MKFLLNQTSNDIDAASNGAKKPSVFLVAFASGMVASSPVVASLHVPTEDVVGMYESQSQSHFSKIYLTVDSISSRVQSLKEGFLGNMTSIATALGVSRQMLYEYVRTENIPEDKLDKIKRLETYSKIWIASMGNGKTLSRMASKKILPYGKSFLEAFNDSGQMTDSVFNELVKVEMKKQKRQFSSRSRNESMPIDYLVLS